MHHVQDDVTSVAAQGPNIWGACVDGTVRRFDIRMGRLYTDDLHHPVTCVVPTGDGLCVLTACLDNALRLLDKGSGELLATYR
jgi:mitogen-activated protein kinase organizer 1